MKANTTLMMPVTAAIAWTVSHPDLTSAIIGVSRPEQLPDQLAGTVTPLPSSLREAIDAIWYDLPRTPPQLDTPRISNFY
jgi:aryl-alcohol dehydrogenase-like predicted oxidoreductase